MEKDLKRNWKNVSPADLSFVILTNIDENEHLLRTYLIDRFVHSIIAFTKLENHKVFRKEDVVSHAEKNITEGEVKKLADETDEQLVWDTLLGFKERESITNDTHYMLEKKATASSIYYFIQD